MRLAIAVSEDVDPYSMDDVMWCLTTRVNPQTDILNPIPGGRGQTFMPAERMTAGGQQWTASNTRFEGGMGIDATVPFGYESDFLRPVYPVDKVKPEDFFSKKDIDNAKSRMVGWVNSLAKHGAVDALAATNRSRDRARAFSASTSRSRGGLVVASDRSSRRAASDTSSTASLNASSFALDGMLKPLSLRTNCSADARISSSVAGGSKLNSVRILRHIERSC